jgi:hypothetical protein
LPWRIDPNGIDAVKGTPATLTVIRQLRYTSKVGRGTQVVRERSAKPLCVSSILTRASNKFLAISLNNHAIFLAETESHFYVLFHPETPHPFL